MTHEQKLAAAKEFLGTKWVLHPQYQTQEKHILHPAPTKAIQ